jgi:glucose/arabinose dehydrogenase
LAGLAGAVTVRGAISLSLPPGFVDELVVGGLDSPRAFAFTPDGRMLIAERGSATSMDINLASIRVFKNGAMLPARAVTLNVCGDGERGFLGLAVDPNFNSNGYIYVYYTRMAASPPRCAYQTYSQNLPGPRNRISRLTMQGDSIDLASEKVLVDNMPTDSGIHNAGDLHFGADGYLYASVGNSALEDPIPPSTVVMSQDLTRLGGKILRILPDNADPNGYRTNGNPFDGQPGAWRCGPLANPPGTGTGACKEIFAYGLRNPFRFTIQPGTSTPFVGDVGGGVWEEVDMVDAGGNYGWPQREGPCPAGVLCDPALQGPTPGLTGPIYSYPHNTIYANVDSAVIAGDFYTANAYPPVYQGNLFIVDYVRGFIRRLIYDATAYSWTAAPDDFATGGTGIIGLHAGPEGDLYYLIFVSDTQAINEIHRIRYDPGGNQAPIAMLGANPLNSPLLSTVYTFSPAGSYDPDNDTLANFHWEFGDGAILNTGSSASVTHTYAAAGAKTVKLTITDNGSPEAVSIPAQIKVFPGNTPASATITLANLSEPARTGSYHAGDSWQFSAAGVSDDKAMPPSPFRWDVVFHHRTHTHPFLSGLNGQNGQFTIPPIGETDPVVWYEVVLHLTDTDGQEAILSKVLNPATTTLTLQTNPPGGQVVLDGGTFSAPLTVTRVVGLNVGVEALSPQQIGGIDYTFLGWSNGGAQAQSVVIPAAPLVLTAIFLPPHRFWMPLMAR